MSTLTIAEAAERLKAGVTVVGRLARSGELPGDKVGRAWVFLADDVDRFIRQRIEARAAALRAVAAAPGRRRRPLPRLS